MKIGPVTFKEACQFVSTHHRHNKPPRGHKFSVALRADGEIVGVAMAGRPVARYFDDGLTLEVNRTCTDGSKNANSQLYGAVWRAAKAMGYERCITYTQADESGVSLRAAGFIKVKELPARLGWAASSVALKDMRDPVGNGGVARILWEIKRTS
ncbi:XF1762 family protein [Pantoea eucalypti]|uniref:XF1762 family protein n=1 Tax=Pantoea eucalypti TaxID=470933 RepID=UPI0016545913|nr:XF1762 family protein [Pantoea eucalypti]